MPKKKNIRLNCKIQKIKRVRFFENELSELNLSPNNIKNSQMSMSAGLNFDGKKNLIIIAFEVNCISNEKELFGIKVTHQFHVPELQTLKNEKGFNIPDPFIQALLATTISGTRGMLEMSKTIPEYKEIVLPMVDTNKLIKDLKTDLS